MCRTARCIRIEAQVLYRMGEAFLLTGELPHAVETLQLALTMIRDVGDPIGEAYVLYGIGMAHLREGEFGPARAALHQALELSGGVGERLAEARALLGLSEIALGTGDPHQAAVLAQQAAHVFHAMETPLYEAHALSLVSEAYAAVGDTDAAYAAAAQVTALRAKMDDAAQQHPEGLVASPRSSASISAPSHPAGLLRDQVQGFSFGLALVDVLAADTVACDVATGRATTAVAADPLQKMTALTAAMTAPDTRVVACWLTFLDLISPLMDCSIP
jgi:tetratricopeptide (TPR) repeat protein